MREVSLSRTFLFDKEICAEMLNRGRCELRFEGDFVEASEGGRIEEGLRLEKSPFENRRLFEEKSLEHN